MRSLCAKAIWSCATFGLLAGCGSNEAPDDDLTAIHGPEIARIVPASQALAGAHIQTLDPASMSGAEIEKGLGTGPHCEFRYTSAGDPWLGTPSQTALLRELSS